MPQIPETISIRRRRVLTGALTSLVAALLPRIAHAQPEQAVDPNDPRAVSLGYTRQHQRVDLKRWPKKADETPEQVQRCASCAMRMAKGGCRLFAGQQVPDDGWCNAWTGR